MSANTVLQSQRQQYLLPLPSLLPSLPGLPGLPGNHAGKRHRI